MVNCYIQVAVMSEFHIINIYCGCVMYRNKLKT